MKKVWLGAVGFVALGWLSTPVLAQDDCAGDCDGSETVTINELISCVNIALEGSPVSACAPCDVDDGGTVTINELIGAVSVALTGECNGPPPGGRCGNGGTPEAGEDCDDGNNFGGDGCAANCTTETSRSLTFDSALTSASVQSFGLLIQLNLSGGQTYQVGEMSTGDVLNAAGDVIFQNGEIPVASRAADLRINPVSVLGALCACVRGVEAEELFGDGISGSGKVSCSEDGLADVNYRVIQDHNTTPGDADNLAQGTPDDAECDDVVELPGGTTSSACLEGTPGSECGDVERFTHVGVCNGPRVLTRSGGNGGMGSAFIINNSAIGQLGGGDCNTTGPVNGVCDPRYEDYGPDCLPCTEDDLEKGTANNLPTTTGKAEAAVFDVNLDGDLIDEGLECNSAGAICVTSATGENVDCDALLNGTGSFGGALAVAFPGLEAATIEDAVTVTRFVSE